MELRRKKKTQTYRKGKKVTGLEPLKQDPYFKKKLKQYHILLVLRGFFAIACVLSCILMLLRPSRTAEPTKELYDRDIYLCMDVSTSVTELNLALIERLKETVTQLDGDRFGIVIFNASCVQLVPLTEDSNYILSVLDELKENMKVFTPDNPDAVFNDYMLAGTIEGSEERGSSLIGDGLATCASDFPDQAEDRTRIILLSTDNDLQGEPLYTLDEAATFCRKKGITVYGIGTQNMEPANTESMKRAVEQTTGSFYTEESEGTVSQIVDSIEAKEKKMRKGQIQIQKVEMPWIPLSLLLFSVGGWLLVNKILKQ